MPTSLASKRRARLAGVPGRPAKLVVFAHLAGRFVPCARLELEEHRSDSIDSRLAYGKLYAQRADALEIDPVSLPLAGARETPGRVFSPVAGSALFGGIRDAAPDAWGRRVIEARLKVPANSLPESVYLLEAGSDRVGALDVRRSHDTPESPGCAQFGDLEHLMDAAQRLEQGIDLPAHLEALLGASTAVGGARPKASIRDAQRRLWLAKFASPGDRFDIPAAEAATLELARRAGMHVSSVTVAQVGNHTVMLVERFDRQWIDQVERRRGMVSALTLMGVHPAEAHVQSYPRLADAMRRHVDHRHLKADLPELFKRMVFNILVHNTDDHLRNHAFLWNGEGWHLSPLYDVLPMPSLAHERLLHLGVGTQGRSATITNALSECGRFGLSPRQATALIDEVWVVVRQWKVHFEEAFHQWDVADRAARVCSDVASAFMHIDRLRG